MEPFGCQKHHTARDLFRFAEAPNRDLRQNVLVQNILIDSAHHLGPDIAGADRVYCDARTGTFLRQSLGESQVARLG